MNSNNTLVRNIAAFTDALGVENAALIWYLSSRVWPMMTIVMILFAFSPGKTPPSGIERGLVHLRGALSMRAMNSRLADPLTPPPVPGRLDGTTATKPSDFRSEK